MQGDVSGNIRARTSENVLCTNYENTGKFVKIIFSKLWKLIKDMQQSRGGIYSRKWVNLSKNRDLVVFSVALFLPSSPQVCSNLESQQCHHPAETGNLAATAGGKTELEPLQGPILWELSSLSLFVPVSQKMAIIYHHNSLRW